jgi:hypothetical protein
MGVFSLNLVKPVEVWFTVETAAKPDNIDLDKYFAAKIEKWLVED